MGWRITRAAGLRSSCAQKECAKGAKYRTLFHGIAANGRMIKKLQVESDATVFVVVHGYAENHIGNTTTVKLNGAN